MIVIHPDGQVRRVKYTGDIQQVLKELNCELFDIVHVNVGDICFDIFVDDEGLYNNLEDGRPKWNLKATHLRMIDWLAHNNNISWSMARKMPPLAGVACILQPNEEGETVDLDNGVNEFVLQNLGEDITMEYDA